MRSAWPPKKKSTAKLKKVLIRGQEFGRSKTHRDAQYPTDPFKSHATEETQCPGL